MGAPSAKTIRDYVSDLIEEGKAVQKSRWSDQIHRVYVNQELFFTWIAKCRHLYTILGEHGKPWGNTLQNDKAMNTGGMANAVQGTLNAILDAIDRGLLIRIEQLVFAEAFDDLLGQADYLAREGYALAAGVLGRAVLEEHLRKLCDSLGCMPTKQRPTLSDFTGALYAGQHIDRLTMKHIEAMAAIGNSAAHNDPKLDAAEVKRLIRDLREFLIRR